MQAKSDLFQVLKPDGTVVKEREPALKEAELVAIYETMVRVRMLNERGMNLQRQGRINFYIGSEGQEAVHVGAGAALTGEDWYFPHYRDPGVALLRGATVESMVHQLYGNAKDPNKGRQMPNHYAYREQNFFSISSPLTTQVPQAVGAAYAMKLRREKHVAVASFGDGSTSEGDFHVGMNFAAVWKCPVVFLCQNNQYAISVPVRLQSATDTFAEKAIAYGMESLRVDGNDALAMYVAMKQAADKARRGEGPMLIEAVTFRMGPHSSSDDPKRYVPPALLEEWKKKDPIDRFRLYLEKRGAWNAAREEKLRADVTAEIQAAVQAAEATAAPPVEDVFTDVFEEMTPQLEKQLADLKQYTEEH
ncbi:MAG TPA: pyruvate dehydrogenase (acetyl-transferring) E1 component subunit alpha [Candidatus Thermoplasmatota archaeon]|nr:pyruvate dehydrogenase (acetyl-transferring) E1 component subunit alpha [Candidatus Thermoplasmatota archaeon]